MTSTSFQHASEHRLFIWEEPSGPSEAKPCLLVERVTVLREGAASGTPNFVAARLGRAPRMRSLDSPAREAHGLRLFVLRPDVSDAQGAMTISAGLYWRGPDG